MPIMEKTFTRKVSRVDPQVLELYKQGFSTKEVQRVVNYPVSCEVSKTVSGFLIIHPVKEG